MSDTVEIQNMRRDQKLAQLYDSSNSIEDYATGYLANMTKVLQSMDMPTVVKAIEMIESCAENDQTFFILGNGGSGAVGGHWVNDLGANTVVDESGEEPETQQHRAADLNHIPFPGLDGYPARHDQRCDQEEKNE